MDKILGYLKQPSTWRGIITVLSGFGIFVSPELMEAIIAAGVGALGLVEVVRNENKDV